jgi:hypothetical protein
MGWQVGSGRVWIGGSRRVGIGMLWGWEVREEVG